MDLSREKTLSAMTSAADLATAAGDALRRTEDRKRDEDFGQVKQSLNDTESADMRKGRDLDADRVGEIRSLMAEGGDKAVAKKFGESALGSPEAVKARAQRAAIRKHESTMAREAIGTAATENDQKKVTVAQQASRTPLRDAAIARQREKDPNWGRQKPTTTGQPSRTPLRDQAVARHRQKELDRDREGLSRGR
ncbi:hypothetical protein [Rhodococcus sp. KRD197]|uniref:hypothetical protein n=1 Tax=Rhodococcus sp. KRD197 TaxID=2729731 RepID=UPI0019D1595D|nr:hypothetical protein [Rhodococcus sp. KRD197]